jgi:cell division protein FtsL
MKLFTKTKQAIKKELDGYSLQKTRKLIIGFMIAFFVLIVMNFCINYLKLFRVKKDVQRQEIQILPKTDLLDEKPVNHQEMMRGLQQMKTDIKKQRKSYEKHSH